MQDAWNQTYDSNPSEHDNDDDASMALIDDTYGFPKVSLINPTPAIEQQAGDDDVHPGPNDEQKQALAEASSLLRKSHDATKDPESMGTKGDDIDAKWKHQEPAKGEVYKKEIGDIGDKQKNKFEGNGKKVESGEPDVKEEQEKELTIRKEALIQAQAASKAADVGLGQAARTLDTAQREEKEATKKYDEAQQAHKDVVKKIDMLEFCLQKAKGKERLEIHAELKELEKIRQQTERDEYYAYFPAGHAIKDLSRAEQHYRDLLAASKEAAQKESDAHAAYEKQLRLINLINKLENNQVPAERMKQIPADSIRKATKYSPSLSDRRR